MVVGGSRQGTLDPGFVLLGTRQQGVPVILRELVLPDGFYPVSPSFTVRDVTTGISEPRPTSCRTEMSVLKLWRLLHFIEIMNRSKLDNYLKPGSSGRSICLSMRLLRGARS
ncbi:unnamed protein product [Schistosoma curassoni]|uniref:GMC_OxRdtase_N domain-containing protein n=1 Tax=Schistosoma curassoni TaxID=6186 RepID=A0A183K5P3_9TREM|nr:unnamed protein product [Schistosoma curassoni]